MQKLFKILVLGSAIIATFLTPTHAQDNEWYQGAFSTPRKTKESSSSVSQRHDEAVDSIRRFASLTFLGPDDTKAYQQNIQALIGNYFFIEKKTDKSELQLIGKGEAAIKELKTEIKDGIIFRAVVQQKWNAGIALPFLAIKLGNQQIAELTIQDNVAVVAEKPIAIDISCNFPVSWEDDAQKYQFYFITAAAVSSITSRRFDSSEADGNGAFSIIKLDGKYFYSDEELTKQNVVAIAKIPVKVLTTEQKKTACKKPEPGKKEDKPSVSVLIDSVKPNILSITGAKPVLPSFDTVVPELSGKVLNVKPNFRLE